MMHLINNHKNEFTGKLRNPDRTLCNHWIGKKLNATSDINLVSCKNCIRLYGLQKAK